MFAYDIPGERLTFFAILSLYGYDTPLYHSFLQQRERVHGPRSLGKKSLTTLLSLVHDASEGRPFFFLTHRSSITASEKQAFLPAGIAVLKTVTLAIREVSFLVTGPGDFRLQKALLKRIVHQAELPKRAVSACHINPKTINPEHAYGLCEGIISPFLAPEKQHGLRAIIYIHSGIAKRYESIAISLSFTESLVVPYRVFQQVLPQYLKLVYPTVWYSVLDEEE